MNNLPTASWSRTLVGFLDILMRVGLSLAVLFPLFVDWYRIDERARLPLLLCHTPLLILIFVVNRNRLFWTLMLLLVSATGAVLGLLVARAANTNDFLGGAFFALVFWSLALTIKHRYTRKSHVVTA